MGGRPKFLDMPEVVSRGPMLQAGDLADELGVAPERIKALAARGYLGPPLLYAALGPGRGRGLWLTRRAAYNAALRVLVENEVKARERAGGLGEDENTAGVLIRIDHEVLRRHAHSVVDALFDRFEKAG